MWKFSWKCQTAANFYGLWPRRLFFFLFSCQGYVARGATPSCSHSPHVPEKPVESQDSKSVSDSAQNRTRALYNNGHSVGLGIGSLSCKDRLQSTANLLYANLLYKKSAERGERAAQRMENKCK